MLPSLSLSQRPEAMGREPCNTSLALGLGAAADAPLNGSLSRPREQRPSPVRFHILFPTCAKREEEEEEEEVMVVDRTGRVLQRAADEQGMSRFRLRSAEAEEEVADKDGRESSGGGGNANGGPRKKLRLTKEQSSLLEDSFRGRNTLTPTQKQELADRLNLRPRQVEVWFQNRRARTKLKQTEVDCEFLKKCCESLSDENRRLKRELQELRSIKPPGPPFYVQLPKAATLTMCPSCERIGTVDGKIGSAAAAAATAFDAVAAAAKGRFYNCAIKDSSMAC